MRKESLSFPDAALLNNQRKGALMPTQGILFGKYISNVEYIWNG